MSLNSSAFNIVSSQILYLLSTKWLSVYPHLLSHLPESIENSHCWCFCEILIMSLLTSTKSVSIITVSFIWSLPRSWLFQITITSLVTWQTSIYSQGLPAHSHILLHVFASKVAKSVLKQVQILQCICNCVSLIRRKAYAKAWVFKVFLNISLLIRETLC